MTDWHNLFEDAFIISAADKEEDIVREVLPVSCSLANSDGGKIVVENLPQSLTVIEEIQNFITHSFSDKSKINMNPIKEIFVESKRGKEFLVINIAPAPWLERPVYLNSDPARATFRYLEGEYFASGKKLLLQMARDSVNTQSDNERLSSPIKIDSEAMYKYRALLRECRPFPKWDLLDNKKFLERVGAFDADEMTLAGAMMFGANSQKRFTLRFAGEKEFKSDNVWNFIELALPKIASLSDDEERTEALKEAFFNSLIHADYTHGGVEVFFDGEFISFKNSGIPRAKNRNCAVCRNARIMKMFRLVELASDRGLGMEIIKNVFGSAALAVDLENWETALKLRVVERPIEASSPKEEIIFYPVVKLKEIAEIAQEYQAPEFNEEPEEAVAIEEIEEAEETEETYEPELPEEIPEPAHIVISVPEEPEDEPEQIDEPQPEEAGQSTRIDHDSLPTVVQMARRNPRTPAAVVREALLDYCRGGFRSLSQISLALLRSEASIKRRYIKPLLAERALEVNEHDAYRTVV